MVLIVPELTGYASIRHIAVSLPYASQLIDHVKHMEPPDVKPHEGDTERRRQRAPRAPSMRFLVKLALKCDSAAELGQRLRRRYQRQQQRAGLAQTGNRDHAEVVERARPHAGRADGMMRERNIAQTSAAARRDG
jgi:hypothetical protein